MSAFNAKSEEERNIASIKTTLETLEGEAEHEFFKRVRVSIKALPDERKDDIGQGSSEDRDAYKLCWTMSVTCPCACICLLAAAKLNCVEFNSTDCLCAGPCPAKG